VARAPRLALAAELHYVVQRGHNRQGVFADDADRSAFRTMLRDAAQHYGVALHAYALLANEVHLLATPADAAALSRLMQSLGRRYVAAFNRRHVRSGTLWAGRFRAGLVDAVALGEDAIVHVESLPVRAGLVAAAADWPWSSAAHHLGRQRDALLQEHPAYWALGNTPFERELAHAHRLREGVSNALAEAFVQAALRGRAMGGAAYSARMVAQAGLPPAVRARGRPRRMAASPPQKTVPD
jgi:putative transposase